MIDQNVQNAKRYREKLYARYSEAFGSQKKYDLRVQWGQFESVYRDTLPVERGVKIADLGCGKGEWVEWVASIGYRDVVGVDVSVSDLPPSATSPGIRWVSANLMDWLRSQEAQSFDVIHLKDVVEHLDRDEFLDLLERAHSVLRPGGRLVIVTFNAQSPLSTATRYGDLTHETGFTPSSMAQGLRCVGFSSVSVAGFHYCSPSLSGRVRSAVGRVVYALAGALLLVRHGKGGRDQYVQLHTALPDMVAMGIRS